MILKDVKNMGKYNINKCFHGGAKFKVPFNRSIVYLAKKLLKNSDKCLEQRNDVIVKKENIKTQNGVIESHIIIPCNYLEKNPGLFYIHGGGFAFDIQPHQYKNGALYAIKTGSIVVLPHYRLTPEVSSPVLLNDCLEAWEWMVINAEKYKIDVEQIGIGGDSAGGYLAAKLTNLIVKNQGNVKYQLLIYPVIDSKMRTKSMEKYTDTPMWNAHNNKIMWQWYYNGRKEDENLLDEKLPSSIPPTYVETAEYDCLHDEGLFYANKLKDLGVNVTIYETYQTMHGFDVFNCEITKEALAERMHFINKQVKKAKEKIGGNTNLKESMINNGKKF